MVPPHSTDQACPRCGKVDRVRGKSILIAKYTPERAEARDNHCGFCRVDQLAVDECDQAVLPDAPLEQFLSGLYCDRCGIGFVEDTTRKKG